MNTKIKILKGWRRVRGGKMHMHDMWIKPPYFSEWVTAVATAGHPVKDYSCVIRRIKTLPKKRASK